MAYIDLKESSFLSEQLPPVFAKLDNLRSLFNEADHLQSLVHLIDSVLHKKQVLQVYLHLSSLMIRSYHYLLSSTRTATVDTVARTVEVLIRASSEFGLLIFFFNLVVFTAASTASINWIYFFIVVELIRVFFVTFITASTQVVNIPEHVLVITLLA